MGQQEVLDHLKKDEDRWFSSRELSDELDLSIEAVVTSLRKLRDTGYVNFESVGRNYRYRHKEKENVSLIFNDE